MMKSSRCVMKSLGLTVTGVCLAAQAASPAEPDVYDFRIPGEEAARGIIALGTQGHVNTMVDQSVLEGVQTNPVNGQMSITDALKVMTAGTRLTFVYLPERREVKIAVAPPPPAPDPADGAGLPRPVVVLDEVVVTAQRRLQNLQQVPVSARVLEGATLAEQSLTSLNDVSEVLPELHVGANSRSANLYIRGTGAGESQVFDQSVGVFVDDIYHGRARMSAVPFLDLERVEVLKGPQPLYFGNDAIAGAFNEVSRQPTSVFEASARALYGQHGDYAAEGAVGGPLTDTLSVRVAALAEGTGGWLHNVALGRDVPANNNLAGRVTLRWLPLTDLEASLKIEGSQSRNIGSLALQDEGCPPPAPFVAAGFCQVALGDHEPIGLASNFIAQNAGQMIRLTTGEAVLTVKAHVAGQILTSVTGAYQYHFNELEDTDGTALQLFNIQAPEKYWQLSQELRLASPTGQPLEYLAGLYVQRDNVDYSHINVYHFLTPTLSLSPALAALVPYLPLGQDIRFAQPEKTYSAFAAGTWHLTPHLSTTAGLRASWVEKSYDWALSYGAATSPYGDLQPLPGVPNALANAVAGAAGLGNAGVLQGSRGDHGVMPTAQVQYTVPGAMAYLSYVRGFKSGGFNGNETSAIAANVPFGPERVNAYETGLKSEWLGHRLRANVDFFRSEYSGLQVASNVAGPTGAILSLVKNAGSSLSQGAEGELEWVPVPAWRLAVSATFDDSRYLTYPGVTPTQLQAALGQSSQDLSERPTEFAPRWSGSLRASHALSLPGGYRLTTSVAGIASSPYFLTGNDDPTVEQGSYVRLDSQLSLTTRDGRWALDLIGRNLTNRQILTFGVNWPTVPGGTWLQKEEGRGAAAQIRFSY